jgi:hemolysin activation/secretion protein
MNYQSTLRWGALLVLNALVVISAVAAEFGSELSPETIGEVESALKQGSDDAGLNATGSLSDSIVEQVQVDQSAIGTSQSDVAEAFKFTLSGVRVAGNSILQSDDIVNAVQEFVDKEVTAKELDLITKRITSLYFNQGYETTSVVIPEQQITDGVVTVQIIENRLGEILLAGEQGYRYETRLFLAQLYDLQNQIIHLPTLNERLSILSRLPGTKVTPRLVKRSDGASNLVLGLQSTENSYSVSVSNNGSKFTGENRVTLSASFNNLTGNSDNLRLGFIGSAEELTHLNALTMSYARPVGRNEGELQFSGSNLKYSLDSDEVSDVIDGGDLIKYEGGSSSVRINYRQPFSMPLLAERLAAQWNLGFEWKRSESSTIYNRTFADVPAGYMPVSGKDTYATLFAGLSVRGYSELFGYQNGFMGQAQFFVTMPSILGSLTQDELKRKADNAESGIDPVRGPIGDVSGMDAEFKLLTTSLSLSQRMPYGLSFDAQVRGQWSSAKKVPQAYEFIGADNGSSGVSLNFGLSRQMLIDNLRFGVAYSVTKANSYFRDPEQNQAPGCLEDDIFTATNQGRNSCTDNQWRATLSYTKDRAFVSATWKDRVAEYAQSDARLIVSAGYRF